MIKSQTETEIIYGKGFTHMEDLKEKNEAVLPDEKGEKVAGGVDWPIVVEYGECKLCGRQYPQNILDMNQGICPYCDMNNKPKPDYPHIPN